MMSLLSPDAAAKVSVTRQFPHNLGQMISGTIQYYVVLSNEFHEAPYCLHITASGLKMLRFAGLLFFDLAPIILPFATYRPVPAASYA